MAHQTIAVMTFNNPPTAPPKPLDLPDATDTPHPSGRWAQKLSLWGGGATLAAGIARRLARLGERLEHAERRVTERFRVPPGGG